MSVVLDDLTPLTTQDGPFLTLLLPAPSHHADAADRFTIVTKNALSEVSDAWPADDLDTLATELAALPHHAGAGVIVVRPLGGPTMIEFTDDPLEPSVTEGPLPRLAPLIESRLRTIAHVVVEADLAGAALHAFDGGTILGAEVVEGETEHIHRGHPGGWSQRRFQQRAENTWDENADDVAAAAHRLAIDVDARLIAVAGPDRAKSMVSEALGDLAHDIDVVAVDAGDVDGIAEAVTRLTADLAAQDAMAAITSAQASMATADDFDGDVLAALEAGRVATLLVHDDADRGEFEAHVDRCIMAALRTGADIAVVPSVSILTDGVAAVLRW